MSFEMINSTKIDGNMSIAYDKKNEAINNRIRFFEKNKISFENTLIIKIKYSDKIFELTEEFLLNNKDQSKLEIETDCIITNCQNIFLYLPFADCIPLTVYDSKNRILAFAHMGWQSIELKLQCNIIDILVNKYGSNIDDIEVVLGPSIKGESYILKNPSQLKYDDWKPFLRNTEDDYYEIDLNGYLCNSLKQLGIKKIINSNIDTAKDENYFSHYRCRYIHENEQEGRFICGVIMRDF